jgi:hypothetical protein
MRSSESLSGDFLLIFTLLGAALAVPDCVKSDAIDDKTTATV